VESAFGGLQTTRLPEIGLLNWAVMFVTLGMNLFVTWYEAREGRRLGSDYLIADAAHTRSDIYVTLGVVASFAGARAGLSWMDGLVAAGIAAFIWWQRQQSEPPPPPPPTPVPLPGPSDGPPVAAAAAAAASSPPPATPADDDRDLASLLAAAPADAAAAAASDDSPTEVHPPPSPPPGQPDQPGPPPR
jgi:hypothetical protein